jgi:sugar lactone lactonase YvrE
MDQLNFTDGVFDVFVDGSKVTLENPTPTTSYGSNGYLSVADLYDLYNVSSISTEDSSPEGLAWKSDGTKLYEMGSGSGKIYEYDVTTAWDVSTASHNGTTISTQDSSPHGLAWKSDGTKLYELGNSSNKFYEYDVSTPWELSTASHNGTTISTQDSIPNGLAWKSDGTKLYEIGSGSNKTYEYDVSTPWDISTASYNNSFNTGDASVDIAWQPNGRELYVVTTLLGSSSANRFTMTTPWDISGTSGSTPVGLKDDIVKALVWKPDGKRVYEIGGSSNKIYGYNMGNARASWTVNLDFTPSTAVVSHTTEGYLGANYTITDSAGNSVTISDAEVGTEYDVSALSDGNLTVEAQLFLDGKMRDFAVYFE